MATMKEVCDGLTILMKYCPDGEFEVQDDVCFADPDITPEMVSEEDAVALNKLLWFWNSKFECWAHFT
jgi:hypothetical protein